MDNSIQPGSGAWGIIFDVYAFQELFENFNVFAAGTYIATPERDAGVISGNLNAANPTIWSVNDSYLGRVGLGYMFWPKYGLTFTLGGRIEGAPVHDLIGSSGGRRRPGYAVSIEPGIVFTEESLVRLFQHSGGALSQSATKRRGGFARRRRGICGFHDAIQPGPQLLAGLFLLLAPFIS